MAERPLAKLTVIIVIRLAELARFILAETIKQVEVDLIGQVRQEVARSCLI